MQTQSLAQVVLQKMKSKKQEQQKVQPHYNIFKLQAQFAFEKNQALKQQISFLQNQIKIEEQLFEKLQADKQELQITGIKNFPRIIIRPQFIASQHVTPAAKQFYRKCSNTYLKAQILRKKTYQQSQKLNLKLFNTLLDIVSLEALLRKKKDKETRQINQRRLKIANQKQRLNSIFCQQNEIKAQFQQEYQANKTTYDEYQFKINQLESRKKHLLKINNQIKKSKQFLQKQYNPINYRSFQATIFKHRLKNQNLKRELSILSQQLQKVTDSTQKLKQLINFSKNNNNKKNRLRSQNDRSRSFMTTWGSSMNNKDSSLRKANYSISLEKSQAISSQLKNSVFRATTDKSFRSQKH